MSTLIAPHVESFQPVPIQIECTSYFQIPHFKIIGLPNAEVSESRERVRAAFQASAFPFPRRNVVINLAPSDLPKSGLGLDLGIALAIFLHRWTPCHAQSSMPEWVAAVKNSNSTPRIAAWGALTLQGEIRPCGQMARVVEALRFEPPSVLVLHPKDAQEMAQLHARFNRLPGFGALMEAVRVADHLKSLTSAMEGTAMTEALPRGLDALACVGGVTPQNSDLCTQSVAPRRLQLSPALHRAILASLAGHHHLLLLGPKGVGKSYAMAWLKACWPEPSMSAQWLCWVRTGEAYFEHSRRWIREVAPDVSPSALLGCVTPRGVRSGEVALAHEGLLIADEFSEWHRDSRECLRTPLEHGSWSLARARQTFHFESQFTFAGTANYCPCGGIPVDVASPGERATCKCSASMVRSYRRRLSGPILDRIDLIVGVKRPGPSASASGAYVTLEPFALKQAVEVARASLIKRWDRLPGTWSAEETEQRARALKMPNSLESLLARASLRTRHKCIRVAATLAALDGCGVPEDTHWGQAWSYRAEALGLT